MNLTVTLNQGQIDYAVSVFNQTKERRSNAIAKCIRPSKTAQLEILAIDDLITAFKSAKPQTVELPVLESLG